MSSSRGLVVGWLVGRFCKKKLALQESIVTFDIYNNSSDSSDGSDSRDRSDSIDSSDNSGSSDSCN